MFCSHTSVSSSPPVAISKPLEKYFIDPSIANRQLAALSIQSIISYYNATNYEIQRSRRLVEYALASGFLHIGRICEAEESILPLLLELQEQVSINSSEHEGTTLSHHSTAFTMARWLIAIPDLALHIVIRFGPPWLLRQYLAQHPLKVIELHNPLTYAAQFGDIYHATMLLDKGLDINGKGAFLDQRDRVSCVLPLTAAAMARDNSHKDSMMTLFLERGSNIPIDTIHAVVGSSDGLTDNTPIIHKLMHHGADPNALDKSGNSALHASLSVYCFGHPNCNCATIVPMLVGAGCKPETLNRDRKSPLHLAAKNGHVQAIRFFIDIGAALPADIIHDAVQAPKSRQTVTSLLLSAGADIAVLPGSGGSALHTVLKPRCHPSEDSELKPRACCEVAQLLVVAGCKADVANFAGETPLNLAVVNGHLPALRVFMGVGTQLPADIIHSAARSQNPEMLRFVLHCGADASLLTDFGDSALHVLFRQTCSGGTHCNCGELAQILLEAGCSCESENHTGESPLHLAIRNHHDLPSVFHVLANFTGGAPPPVVDIIHALAGVGVSQPHFKVGRSKTTLYPRHYEGEFNSLSSSGDTALHIFLKLRNCRYKECRCTEVARILVEHGCHSKNHAGESPLFLAVQNYHLPVVDLLVGKGARVSDEIVRAACATTDSKHSPFVAPINTLLQYRVDYNTFDLHGDTPIHTLLRKSCPLDCDCLNTVLLLVAAGYDPKSLGDDGKSIVQIAAENAHMSTVQYLLDLGVEFTHDLIHTVARCHKHSESLTVIQSLLQRGGRPDMLTPSGDTLLHSLARSPCPRSHQTGNYLETVDRLCQLGNFDLDFPNICGETALHLAAREDNLALLRHLLDLGCALPADILHFAVEKIQPNLEVIKFLIDRGASAESRNHRGDTLLHSLMRSTMWSVEDAHADVVHYVVALDVCDINGLDAFGKAPLHYAAENGLSPYVQLLLDKGARIPTDIMHSVIHHPYSNSNSISIIQMYFQEGAPLDLACSKNGNTLLHTFIIRTGASDPAHINPAITRYVMESQGCNIHSLNLWGESPIFLAFKHHNEMAAKYLLARGAQIPEGIVHTVLRHPSDGVNHERLVTLILHHGGTIHSLNNEGGNALHSLLRGLSWGDDERDLGMIKFLILHGCDIDARDFDGRTPFHYAARNNNLAVVHFLIDKGAQFPEDILHDALANHNEQSFHAIFRLLSERGASISARTAGGNTTLHAVLRESVCRSPTAYLCMTRLLIDKGCELNVLNSFGESPLHLAVQLGYISIVRLLLDKGAKLYQGVIHSAINTTKSAFRPILKMLIDGELGDQTIFLERESHGLLHALCQQTFETECMHRAQVLQEFGLCVEKHVNTEDNKGYTPLGIVLNRERPSPLLVSYLIDIGAKFSYVNYLHLDNLRWACELSWYPDAVKAYYAMLGRQSINLGGVREVQSVLACRFNLPPRVVNRILEAAGYWVCSSVTYRNVEFTYRQPKVWLSLPWLSSSASDVKPRRMVITYKMRDGRPSRPFLYQTKVSVSNGHQDAIPGLLPIRSRNSRLEVTNLIETAVWDRHDDPRKINGFSLDDLAHDDTLSFEGDMDIDPDDAEIELEFLRIDMYYAVSY
ncbi:ankyrin [Paxillus ammoniavirescens]|nr:ankyrin [Paxillus ammoniavirescens]